MADSAGGSSTGLNTRYDDGIPGLYVTIVVLALIVILIAIRTLCCKDCCSRNGDDAVDADFFLRLEDSTLLSPQQEQELREKRRKFVLKHIVIKKAKRRRDAGKIILPHERELSKRSSILDIPKELDVSTMDVENAKCGDDSDSLELQDETASQINQNETIVVKKEDILVDSFREWRSTRHGIDDSIQSSIYSPQSCSICMSKYKQGDEICWSKNEKCYHAFHLECMLEWLMKHNECPMCRRHYLRTDESNGVENHENGSAQQT